MKAFVALVLEPTDNLYRTPLDPQAAATHSAVPLDKLERRMLIHGAGLIIQRLEPFGVRFRVVKNDQARTGLSLEPGSVVETDASGE